MPIVHL